jgi:C4-dicarboxylate-specific signal transduction histidine kinase
MDLNLGQNAIEKLYPFYLCLNTDGTVASMGRSAPKCFLNAQKGMHFSTLFKVIAPRAFHDSNKLESLRDKIVSIQSTTTDISLNGEMIPLPDPSLYLFAVSPVIQDVDALTKYNLSYSDFPVFSPVFDFLILTQAERFARKEQSKALNALEEQNTFAKLNLEIANFCSRCSELQDAFDFVIYTLQNFLNVQVSFEKCESSMPPDAHYSEHKISLPLIVDNKMRNWLHLESDQRLNTGEPLKIFLGSLRFTLENLITRMDQFNSLQEAQVLKLNSSKMYTLGEMAAGIAHELNNPLAVIQGVAWLTLTKLNSTEVSTSKLEENMNKILKMTERSSKIINGLRVFARDAAEDPMEKIEISSIVQETLELCKTRIAHRGIRLDVQLKAQYHSWGRPVQISQVLLNLLNNATDAIENTEDAWIRIDVRKKDEFWVISVTDSGNGIPKDIVEKMMSPFFTTKPPGKGTGLGLSISGSILKNHGGEFWYDTQSPNTTFCFSLPVLATLQT